MSTERIERQQLLRIVTTPVRLTAAAWATSSQARAQNNAMRACSVLAQQRDERVEAAEYVASYLARRDAATVMLVAGGR